ncbi:MAG: ABC transporter permease [Candidatus Heimdallarchaeota archaeon]|nr:ABC transporter permease [Candidatus Heimdallarchaeota archaeon]
MRFAYLIAIRLWKQLSRDRRTLGLATVAPLLFVVLFGVAFGGEIDHVPVIVINQDSDAEIVIKFGIITIFEENVSAIGNSIVTALDLSLKVDINQDYTDFETAKEEVVNKRYRCAILIPENFTYNMVSPLGDNISISLYLDNSDPQIAGVVLQAISDAFQDSAGSITVEYAYGDDLRTIDFFGPAIIAFGVFFFAFILVIMNLIGERKTGTLPLLLQCPFDKGQIILGYLFAFSLLSAIQTTVIILFSSLFFGITFGTSLAHYISIYITAIVLGWTGLVLAIFLSSFARSEFQAVQFIPTIILPVILLSGIIIPLDQIPEVIRWVAYLLPTTYGVSLLRAISIEGVLLNIFSFEFLFQIFFFVVFLLGSRISLRET